MPAAGSVCANPIPDTQSRNAISQAISPGSERKKTPRIALRMLEMA
jgi:hypothetical protein